MLIAPECSHTQRQEGECGQSGVVDMQGQVSNADGKYGFARRVNASLDGAGRHLREVD